ncbi:MAG: DUF2799 domain-containing protein [Bdellovibrionaceae bacterium]|nr:DUF2799 domain-containing protein [Pseudobdellovibrionaceae bacterium]
MTGKRLSGDTYLNECRKADSEIDESQLDLGFKAGMLNYCKPEVVFANGKKGEFFNADLCDPGLFKTLNARHAEGVNIFCEPSNGYTFGSSGGTYNQICPKHKEEGFLKDYRRGRKKYLAASINENHSRINKLNSEMNVASFQKSSLESELRIVEAAQAIRPQNENANNANQVDPREEKKRDLRSKISQSDTELRAMNANRNRLQEAIYSMEKELLTLD